jgi:hypothetical protein
MAASLATLRPTFDRFYSLLNDEQKARLVAMTLSKVTAPQSEERTRFRENRDPAQRPGSSGDGSYCQQWVKYLKSWPVRQIEDRTPLSDDQRATIYRAASKLGTRCHADDHFTPPGCLDAGEEELKAWQQSVDSILPEALDLKTSSLIPVNTSHPAMRNLKLSFELSPARAWTRNAHGSSARVNSCFPCASHKRSICAGPEKAWATGPAARSTSRASCTTAKNGCASAAYGSAPSSALRGAAPSRSAHRCSIPSSAAHCGSIPSCAAHRRATSSGPAYRSANSQDGSAGSYFAARGVADTRRSIRSTAEHTRPRGAKFTCSNRSVVGPTAAV